MTSKYGVSVDSVRASSGIASNFISDDDFLQLIESAEVEVDKILNTSFIPVTRIDFIQGNFTNRIMLNRNPVLKVRALKISDEDIDLDNVRLDSNSGIVWLESNAEYNYTRALFGNRNLVRVKYDFGLMDNTSTQAITDGAVVAGTSVSIKVASSSSFTLGDYVEIKGFDSKVEVFKISNIPDSTHIVADVLSTDHEDGSLLTKLEIPKVGLRLVQVIASMMGVARVVGQSYDEITSYSLGDMSVTKGEPYTQWREVTVQLQKEYKSLLESFRVRPVVV